MKQLGDVANLGEAESADGAECTCAVQVCCLAEVGTEDAAQESGWCGDCVQAEPIRQAVGVRERRTAGAGQQPKRAVEQAICDRAEKLAVCQHAARRVRDGEGGWAEAVDFLNYVFEQLPQLENTNDPEALMRCCRGQRRCR